MRRRTQRSRRKIRRERKTGKKRKMRPRGKRGNDRRRKRDIIVRIMEKVLLKKLLHNTNNRRE